MIALAFFVPLILAVGGVFRKPFGQATPMVFIGLPLILYVLGLFSLLPCAVWFLYFLWGGSILYLGIIAWHKAKKKQWAVPSPGMALFVAAAIILWWMCRGSRFFIWDEFSHWGRAVKALYMQEVLPAVAAGEDLFRDYPPGVALLQAAVLKVGRMSFREDVVIFVQGLFSVALLFYPVGKFGWKNSLGAVLAAILLVLAPATVFWNYYVGTMVDGLLGVLFAFVLLVHFLGEQGVFEKVLKCMAMAMLPMVKTTGLLWAAMAFAIILVDTWRQAKVAGSTDAAGEVSVGSTSAVEKARWAPGWYWPGVCAAGTALSWQVYLRLFNVPARWQAGAGLQGFISGESRPWQLETAGLFAKSVFTEQNYGWPVPFLPFVGFFLVFAAAWWVLRRLLPAGQKRRFGLGMGTLICAGLLYVVLLLCNYMFMFTEYEAVRLASLSRYLNTYVAGAMMFLAGWVAEISHERKPAKQLLAFGVSAVAWAVLSSPAQVLGYLFTTPQHAVSTAANQQPYTDAATEISSYATGDLAKVYVIAQDDLGATTLRLGYELTPQVLPEHISSIGSGYAEDDLLSLRITRQQWADVLKEEYEFVYLFKVDDAFTAEFGPLFTAESDIAEGQMYRVLPRENGVALELASQSLGDYCYTGTCN